MNLINPVDLFIILLILLIVGFGLNNGFIIELKKIVNLFLSLVFSKLIVQYIPINNYLGITKSIVFFTLLIILLFLIGFLLDLLIINLPNFDIDKYVDKLIASLLSIIKALLIISILLFIFDMSPIQGNLKERVYSKASSNSISFQICKNIQEFFMY